MFFNKKHFLVLISMMILMMSLCAATDSDDSTNITQESIKSSNNIHATQEENTIINDEKNEENKIIKNTNTNTKSSVQTDVTNDNWNEYFKLEDNVLELTDEVLVKKEDITLYIHDLPDDITHININGNSSHNTSITLIGKDDLTLQNTRFNIGGFNNIQIENMNFEYDTSYNDSYVTIGGSNAYVNNISINAVSDNSTNYSSALLEVNSHAIIENCNITGFIPESLIDWNSYPYVPLKYGVLLTGSNIVFRNNFVNITSNGHIGDYIYWSSYDLCLTGENATITNNTMYLSGKCYAYSIVIRSKNNNILNNSITVKSQTYSAGIYFARAYITNNLVKDNIINLTADKNRGANGNHAVTYGITFEDSNYYGGIFNPSNTAVNTNYVINNTVYSVARQTYGVEVYGGVNIDILSNTFIGSGNSPTGVAVLGYDIKIKNNTIDGIGKSNKTDGTVDYMGAITSGITAFRQLNNYIISDNIITTTKGSGIYFKDSLNGIIENNTLISDEHDYTIEINGTNNSIENNLLISREYEADESVNICENNTVRNNGPITTNIKIISPDVAFTNESTPLIIQVVNNKDELINTTIKIKVDDNDIETFSLNGELTYNLTNTKTPSTSIIITHEQNGLLTESQESLTIPVKQKIILTPENFQEYISNATLNDNVKAGAVIDVSGKFDDERYAFTVNKAVNITSSSSDAFFCFYSTPKLEGTSELPDNSFIINNDGSETNITGITFENTMIATTNANDIIFDNISVYCTSGYGWGRGSTSIRNSENVTIKNSYFNTTDNNGVSTLVLAASQNCNIENCTIWGSGYIGNLVYATTYNVDVNDQYGNNNITIRNNKIIGRNLSPGIATCYSVCLIGNNITVENNYIENNNKYLIMTQYADSAYQVDGESGSLIIRNNTFNEGKISINFDPCTIENNTYYENLTIEATNNTTIKNNRKQNTENTYLKENNIPEYIINIEAPDTYTYTDNINATITITDTKTQKQVTNGKIEIYTDGKLNKTITINNNQPITITYTNTTPGDHHIRAWYYPENENTTTTQKLKTTTATPITSNIQINTTKTNPEIGDTITITAYYTLEQNIPLTTNFTISLPGQKPTTITTKNNTATITTTITTDYIKDILGAREQNIKIIATTNNTNIEIKELNTKLGVQKAQTTITVTPTNTTIGQKTTLQIKLNTKTNLTINKGSITLTNQNNETLTTSNINNNQATITLTFNQTGNNKITITYNGTVHYNNTNKTITITVNKINTKITLNKINNVYTGESASVTGTLTDTNGNKISGAWVQITNSQSTVSAKTDSNGKFTKNITTQKLGTNNITITYTGNNNYTTTTTQTSFTTQSRPTKIIINPITSTAYGGTINITGTITTQNSKPLQTTLNVTINRKTINVTSDKTGTFKITTKTTKPTTATITISFKGNDYYSANTTTAQYTVTARKTIITINKINNIAYGGTLNITGTFRDEFGNLFKNTALQGTLNGKTFNLKTNTEGVFTITTKTSKPSTNNITINFKGNTNYLTTSNSTTFNVTARNTTFKINTISNVVYGQTLNITGVFKDEYGNLFKNTAIQGTLNGKTFTVKTDTNGVFTITTKINTLGNNTITMSFKGNTNYLASNSTTTFTSTKAQTKININTIGTVKKGTNITITGTFKDQNNNNIVNSALKGNLNGNTFTVKTNNKGEFTITTRANTIGTNNITITYPGSTYYQNTNQKATFTVKT